MQQSQPYLLLVPALHLAKKNGPDRMGKRAQLSRTFGLTSYTIPAGSYMFIPFTRSPEYVTGTEVGEAKLVLGLQITPDSSHASQLLLLFILIFLLILLVSTKVLQAACAKILVISIRKCAMKESITQ